MPDLENFRRLTPAESPWSDWAKPIVFAKRTPPAVEIDWPRHDEPTPMTTPRPGAAMVVDLPGPDSLLWGVALARLGWRPVPLFNGVPGTIAVVDTTRMDTLLGPAAREVAAMALRDAAPPAFLLDDRRLKGDRPGKPGDLDNRWMVFPQDFPSAGFLKTQGVREAVLIQQPTREVPQSDLAHVLRRWQEQGLQIMHLDPASTTGPTVLNVARPSRFRGLWYAAMALAGFRRNSAGGFGSIIPQPGSAG